MNENLLPYTTFVTDCDMLCVWMWVIENEIWIEKGKTWIPSTHKVIQKTLKIVTPKDSLKKKKLYGLHISCAVLLQYFFLRLISGVTLMFNKKVNRLVTMIFLEENYWINVKLYLLHPNPSAFEQIWVQSIFSQSPALYE